MKTLTREIGSLLFVALLAPFSGACFGDDSTACEGALNCACYPNSAGNVGICQTPLVCVKNICVAAGSSGPDASGPLPDSSITFPDATTAGDDATTSSPDSTSGGDDATMMMMGMDATESADAPSSMMDTGGGGPGVNVVTNGDFSMGTMYWGTVGGNGTFMVNGGMGCVAVPANGNSTLGWPEAPNPTGVPLMAGTSYTLKYTAVSTMGGNVSVDAKVGQTMQPYNADFETSANQDSVTGAPMTFTHTFTAMNADSSAGIAFMVPQMGNVTPATTVCFQNVSLIQN